MNLFNEDDEEPLVNLYEFYRFHGVGDVATMQMVLHILLTRSYGAESEARTVAAQFHIDIPYVLPDTDNTH